MTLFKEPDQESAKKSDYMPDTQWKKFFTNDEPSESEEEDEKDKKISALQRWICDLEKQLQSEWMRSALLRPTEYHRQLEIIWDVYEESHNLLEMENMKFWKLMLRNFDS